ncbi:MAG: hypothetical protein JWM55_1164 [Acidimicrobiaceae bacterium]|nr:hypothetical protein [Acidimicrobiaceae bacterium]
MASFGRLTTRVIYFDRRRVGSVAFLILSLTVGLATVAPESFASPVSVTRQPLSAFENLMSKGTSSAYVASYQVTDFDYFSRGTITVTNLPPSPGAKSTPNVNGYSSTLKTAFVFRGTDGRVVQWIHNEANVSACSNTPSSSGYKNLQCSRPSPFIQSNGYSEEELGFVPAFVLQTVKSFDSTFLAKTSSIFTEESQRFGALRCIRQKQVTGSMQETTCLNRAGLLVSWSSRNAKNDTGQVELTSLSHHPTSRDLSTMKRPTKSIILPPF